MRRVAEAGGSLARLTGARTPPPRIWAACPGRPGRPREDAGGGLSAGQRRGGRGGRAGLPRLGDPPPADAEGGTGAAPRRAAAVCGAPAKRSLGCHRSAQGACAAPKFSSRRWLCCNFPARLRRGAEPHTARRDAAPAAAACERGPAGHGLGAPLSPGPALRPGPAAAPSRTGGPDRAPWRQPARGGLRRAGPAPRRAAPESATGGFVAPGPPRGVGGCDRPVPPGPAGSPPPPPLLMDLAQEAAREPRTPRPCPCPGRPRRRPPPLWTEESTGIYCRRRRPRLDYSAAAP